MDGDNRYAAVKAESDSLLYQIQMKSGMRDICGGKVNETSNGKGGIVAFWQQEIKQTIYIVGIDFEKAEVRTNGANQTIANKHGTEAVIRQTIGGDHL